MANDLTTQQKGRCGELFVQYMLLKHGIESAPLTTDTGIDLVAYPRRATKTWPFDRPATIQVKTSSHREANSDYKGNVAWFISNDCPTDFIATVDFEANRLWLFPISDFKAFSTKASNGHRGLWWHIPDSRNTRMRKLEPDLSKYEMGKGIKNAFGL